MKIVATTARFHCMDDELFFDVSVMIDEKKELLTFLFTPDENTLNRWELFGDGLIKVVTAFSRIPQPFTVPSTNAMLRQQLAVCIFDFVVELENENVPRKGSWSEWTK